MVERNKELMLCCSAQIVYKGKTKELIRRKELEVLEQKIDKLPDEIKRNDGRIVLDYIMHGQRIVLKSKEEIHLFPRLISGRITNSLSIVKNPELYALLKDIVEN